MKKNIVLLGIGHTHAHIVHQWERHAIDDETSGLDLQTASLHFADHDSISFNALPRGVGSNSR